MSVRILTDTSAEKASTDCRCYNLIVDGSITLPDDEIIESSSVDLNLVYSNDSYTQALSDCNYSVCGNMVTLQLKQATHTIVSTGGNFTITGLPTSLRPALQQDIPILGESAGAVLMCILRISTGGVVTIYKGIPPDVFSSSGVAGLPYNITVTYSL